MIEQGKLSSLVNNIFTTCPALYACCGGNGNACIYAYFRFVCMLDSDAAFSMSQYCCNVETRMVGRKGPGHT